MSFLWVTDGEESTATLRRHPALFRPLPTDWCFSDRASHVRSGARYLSRVWPTDLACACMGGLAVPSNACLAMQRGAISFLLVTDGGDMLVEARCICPAFPASVANGLVVLRPGESRVSLGAFLGRPAVQGSLCCSLVPHDNLWFVHHRMICALPGVGVCGARRCLG